ncbi:hypothetical protein P170DRAFT_436886 [Aspergillus steynii IBT 23096]|uniref:Uncharacterized protein n=1 Tax=Aspergillus steynii IBT 23096 TaxID=1392250 RepID=A0A2I2G8T7_9EURO|nr:uncharacterized protein P170DRAFT_436886 [Aspergillus steynii IBT 23096]PLB49268.1 hypothetical protein P170DRAFT_436886 [Aspergillus steynii IBT 23096]
MTTVAITSDLEPYLASLRSYLAREKMDSSSSSSSMSPRPEVEDAEGSDENSTSSPGSRPPMVEDSRREVKREVNRKVEKYTARPVGKESIPRSSLP